MLNNINIIYSVIIVIIILVIYLSRSYERDLLKGFWKADADFCDKADLSYFILYIGNSSVFSGHSSYIVASNINGIILNNQVKMSFSGLSINPLINNKRKYNIDIDWLDDEIDDDVFPSCLSAEFYPKYGKLVLYKDDDIKAILYKDSQMTSLESSGLLLPDETLDLD
jgi:hypothetical protein